MGRMTRIVAVAGLAATALAGTTVAAHAQGAAGGATGSGSAVTTGVESSGQYWCGYDRGRCETEWYKFKHYGFNVSPIWYREGQTCPGGANCADGYYFNWWS